MNRRLLVIAGVLLFPPCAVGQTPAIPPGAAPPGVPALPGASAASVNPPVAASNEEILRQMQEAQRRLADMTRTTPPVVRGTGAAATNTAPAPVALAAGGAPTPTAASLTPKAVPPAPTVEDVRRAERRLARLRSQVHTEEIADSGLVKASDSSHVRARVQFPYLDGSIYEIYAAPDRMTAIELQPGEHLTTDNGQPKAADTVQWVADAVSTGEGTEKRTIILVKPIVTGVETNMLIPTNRHVYHLLLRSDTQVYMPLVGFSYPFDEAKAKVEAGAAEAKVEASREKMVVPPEKLSFNYKIRGSRAVWKPVRVFDDGTKTYIEMAPEVQSWEAPALFVMEGDTPLLVNYRVKGDYYIVDRLFEHAQLRVGSRSAVDIYRDKT